MIIRKRLIGTIVALTAFTVGFAPRAHAGGGVFLTGTWTGSIKCKAIFGGTKDPFTLTPEMRITQSGFDLAIQLFYGGTDVENYSGRINPDLKKPLTKGEVAVVACGTNDQLGDDPDYDEVGRMTVSTKGLFETGGSFKGTSIFSDPGISPAEVGTCKWKWKRTNLTDPNLPLFCGHTALTLPPSAP